MQYKRESGNPFNSFTGIIVMVLGLLAVFFLARIVFRLLYILSPFMLVAAVIIDYKVVVEYVQWIRKLFKKNAITGIGAGILSLLGFPVVSAFLLGKALFRKKIKNVEKEVRKSRDGELIDYEEIKEKPIELPKLEKQKRTETKESTDYDNLFE